MVERLLGKDEVISSILIVGSKPAFGRFDPEAALKNPTNRRILAAEGPKSALSEGPKSALSEGPKSALSEGPKLTRSEGSKLIGGIYGKGSVC